MVTAERPLFRSRDDAGAAVARSLRDLSQRDDVVVLGLARGGVIVARAVAQKLRAPLDVMIARKLGVPGIPEVALGAIAESNGMVLEDSIARYLGVDPQLIARIERRQRREGARRVGMYRAGRPLGDVHGRTVVLVDDGLATGATIRAAVHALRTQQPARIIVACPVGSRDGCRDVATIADEVVVLATPEPFETVSRWYESFDPVSDGEVLSALGRHAHPNEAFSDTPDERGIQIPINVGACSLDGDLGLPNDSIQPHGLVVLVHGGGSSRQSYRNRFLAGCLRMAGWATLRVDLLLPDEQERDRATAEERFAIPFLTDRLCAAVDWAVHNDLPGAARLVMFGASTGAAAALRVAVERRTSVAAVVSRGGRVDLAGSALQLLGVPTLMVVGGADRETLRRHRRALRAMRGDVTLKIVRGAGHTFEEEGAIGAVARHVTRWLAKHVAGQRTVAGSWWRRVAAAF